MSEETKEPLEETPVTAETAETEQEKTPENQEPEKKAKKKEKKEKGITFTREQVEKMELTAKQLESVKDQFTRLTAEYDNYRKRTTKEKDGIYQDAKGDTIKTFLAVYDNLERAAAAEGGEDDPHKKGLEMIFHQFKELLAKEGVKEIEAKGKEFDPELMDAVMHIEDESLGENVVAQVFQAGFDLTMVGLDVTRKIVLTPDLLEYMCRLNKETGEFVKKITKFYFDFHWEWEHIIGCVINDPLAVAYFINPEFCKGFDSYVQIETEGISLGQSVVDSMNFYRKASNARVLTEVDVYGFFQMFLSRILDQEPEKLDILQDLIRGDLK